MNSTKITETKLPFELSPPTTEISNSAFIRAVFDGIDPDAVIWLTSFDGDPGNTGPGDWIGYGVGLDAIGLTGIDRVGEAGANTFFTISSFRGALDEATGHRFGAARRKALHVATHVFVLDDVGYGPGAKIPPTALPGITPSYIVETSPDNWQVGYIMSTPVTDAVLAAKFLDSLVADGLQEAKDPGMKGVTRNVRLPVGCNGKPKYTVRGESPHHRLLHWKPSTRYQLEDLCAGFGLDLTQISIDAEGGVDGVRSGLTEATDPWIPVIEATGVRMERPNDKGPDGVWVDMGCLWQHEHTGEEDSGSAYCIGGGYQCHHGHCIDNTWLDARRALLEWDRDDGTVQRMALHALWEEAFGDWWVQLPPPLPGRPPEGSGEPVPVRGYDEIFSDAQMLRPDLTSKGLDVVRGLLRDIDAARLSGSGLAAVLKVIGDQSQIPVAALKADLKDLQTERAVERRKAAAEKQVAEQMAGTLKGKRPEAIMLPGALATDAEGVPHVNTTNVERLIHALGGSILWNEMLLEEEATGTLNGYSGDAVVRIVQDAMEANEMRRNQQAAVPCMRLIAEGNGYHPMKDYLLSLSESGGWDGVDRLCGEDGKGGLFGTVKLQHETKSNRELTNLVLTKWLYSVVAAAHYVYKGQPGNQPRGVLVFVGGQHTGKTTWLARLFAGLFPGSSRCFIGGAHFGGTTDDKLNVLGALITELGEIDSTMNRSEAGLLKAFLSNDMDRVRRPYGRVHTDLPRRTVFAGTVNDPQYLKDKTGNTRFWTVAARRMDLDAQRQIDMRQVWAQLQDKCREGMMTAKAAPGYSALPWHMTREEMARVEAANNDHRVLSDAEDWLLDTFDWDHKEWTEAQKGSELDRLRVNGMSMTEILGLTGAPNGGRRSGSLSDALRRMTGQGKVRPTQVDVHAWYEGALVMTHDHDKDGKQTGEPYAKKITKKGRLIAVPPLRAPNRDAQRADVKIFNDAAEELATIKEPPTKQ